MPTAEPKTCSTTLLLPEKRPRRFLFPDDPSMRDYDEALIEAIEEVANHRDYRARGLDWTQELRSLRAKS